MAVIIRPLLLLKGLPMAKTLYVLKAKTPGLMGKLTEAILLADHKNFAHILDVGTDNIAYFSTPDVPYDLGLVFLENNIIHSFEVRDVMKNVPVRSVLWGY